MTVIDARGVPAAVFGSTALLRRRYERWDAAIRSRLATPRRVGVMQLRPGVGATTVAARLTAIIAARRPDPVLAVDVSGAVGATPPSDTRAFARTSAEATAGLSRGPEGQFVLRPPIGEAGGVGAWLAEAAPITRFFDVTVTDFGVRDPLIDAGAAAAVSDVVCLVSAADRASAEQSRALAAGIRALPEQPRVVLVLVDRNRDAEGAPRVVAAHSPDPVIVIGRPASLAARTALQRLAATVLSDESSAA